MLVLWVEIFEEELFSQSSLGAGPIYSTNYVAGMAMGRRRLETNHFQHFDG